MNDKDLKEGHSREWQDRARVVLDAKEKAQSEASPNQSPVNDDHAEGVEEKSEHLDESENDKNDSVY